MDPHGRRSRRLRPLFLTAAVGWAVGVWLLSSTSDPPGSELFVFPLRDKLAHGVLFLVQAGLLRLAGLAAPVAAGVAIGLGLVDELHQAFVPGRSPDPLDLLADALGAVAGAWGAARSDTGGRSPR